MILYLDFLSDMLIWFGHKTLYLGYLMDFRVISINLMHFIIMSQN